MVNASFPKCIIEVIHTHLSIIGICLATDSESILNERHTECSANQIFFIVIQAQFYDSLATEKTADIEQHLNYT